MLRIAVMVLALLAAPATAQDVGAPPGILILDQEALFAGTQYGQRVLAELDAAGQALAAENRAIEAQLTAEELDLTDRRAETPRAEFTLLAEDFDARVEVIRAEQEAKSRALNSALDQARQTFFELAVPLLLDLMRDRGAAAILDNRTVLLAPEAVNITGDAIAAFDAAIGAGPEGPLIDLTPEPVPRPDRIE